MAILKIARLGHPIIRSMAAPVAQKEIREAKFQQFLEDMIETMRDAHGVGISAPQVHLAKRILVVEVDMDNPRYPIQEAIPLTIIINPEILEHSDDLVSDWEGCLSIPDLKAKVPRWSRLVLSGLDRYGKAITIRAEGFLARVIQHELDHLDGFVFLDRLPDLKTLTHVKEYQQYWTAC